MKHSKSGVYQQTIKLVTGVLTFNITTTLPKVNTTSVKVNTKLAKVNIKLGRKDTSAKSVEGKVNARITLVNEVKFRLLCPVVIDFFIN